MWVFAQSFSVQMFTLALSPLLGPALPISYTQCFLSHVDTQDGQTRLDHVLVQWDGHIWFKGIAMLSCFDAKRCGNPRITRSWYFTCTNKTWAEDFNSTAIRVSMDIPNSSPKERNCGAVCALTIRVLFNLPRNCLWHIDSEQQTYYGRQRSNYACTKYKSTYSSTCFSGEILQH